ncbi:Nitroreductase [Peptoclostridium litorale DSM 5388]|uniref:Putative nitroreductase TM1586 domain-containing protein n=1 Tax=Peptoclostridium litorale DSM 5388 TaxID=1121324 RepID=A0A069REA7_PEPLI|nr:nitroreductase family protein [Peptoclostridium litorale]KDR93939.1 hypothetical protein CLIT_23c02110 [Peptoclostridium litorale DSM 5388]KDR95366.1 hypothetical protein CLIT_10c00930 [Peptoclostridium litorale DSM 5388]SIN88986.1 Nitroreductase [Peptoclostridium litorale DSM 5388]
MNVREFLEKRYSVREYDKKGIDPEQIKEIMDYAKKVETELGESGIKFVIFEDGNSIYEKLNGYAGYAGVMIKSPHYIGVLTDGEDYKTQIMSSYAMEAVVKKVFEMGLGTCWIDFSKASERLREEISKYDLKNINYAVAIGHPKKESKLKFGYVASTTVSGVSNDPYREITDLKPHTSGGRLSVEEMVFNDQMGTKVSVEELEQRGISDMLFHIKSAPSAKNLQPWRFILTDGKIVMAVKDPDTKESMTDAGIMMYLFEGMAHDMGIRGKWEILPKEEFEYQGEKFAFVGQFNL